MKEEKIEKLIRDSCKKLYEKDSYLISNNICERAIVFRLGLYMQYFMSNDEELKEYNLDNEYNKNIGENKLTESYPNGRYVDLIIHKRGDKKNNILAIECKKNNIDKVDKEKIDDLMSPNDEYKYKYGATITFQEDRVIYHIKSYGGEWKQKKIEF